MALGNKLFHGDPQLGSDVGSAAPGARVFAYPVRDPERYGVVEFNSKGRGLSIEEKPDRPKSRLP